MPNDERTGPVGHQNTSAGEGTAIAPASAPRRPLRRARLMSDGTAVTWTETGLIVDDLEIEYTATFEEANREIGTRQRAYMLSPEEHGRMWRGQKKRCWVCRRRCVRLVVDHDHKRRRVRALLCDTDNKVEGLLAKIGVRTLQQLQMWALRLAALRTEARW
jgi:hypothetical protein